MKRYTLKYEIVRRWISFMKSNIDFDKHMRRNILSTDLDLLLKDERLKIIKDIELITDSLDDDRDIFLVRSIKEIINKRNFNV